MRVLWVLAIIAAVLFLLSLIRVGGDLEYAGGGLLVRLRVGKLHLVVYPGKVRKKEKTRKKAKTKPPAPPVSEKKGTGDTWDLLRQFFPLMADAAGRLKRKIHIDRLDVDLTVAASDPAAAAIAYGGANAAIGMMIPILENNFIVKERNIRTRVDFNRPSPEVWLNTAFSLTIGQGAALSLRLGMRAIKIFMEHRRRTQQQKEAL